MNKVVMSIVLSLLLVVSAPVNADIYSDAVANPARSDKERAVDVRRKPAQILEFFGIKPGMHVLDVFAGGGYYSEILSYLVGESGSVTLYNNQPWFNFVGESITPRLKDNRLPNVENLITEPESIGALEKEYDAAIFILGWHDVYYADPDNGWVAIDKSKFLSGIMSVLKEGGVLGVIDANAESGADNAVVGQSLHRVDPKVMISDIVAAGFVLEESSELLSNPKDDKTTSVFLPENRYLTDRTVLKFRKPKSE